METEEVTKLVDGIYKNILDKFNPGARQLISAGKAYLKALHGAAAASRTYVDAVGKLGRNAQQNTWGGSTDIGTALMQIVGVYKEIQEQQMNILKAFYVDLLVPLETNLEKDTKVVQSEQKRFMQQHKQRAESYSKAAAAIKKQRKKRSSALDKELKNMQLLEEEKSKLDAFCEQSLKNAMTQERRRYGFVLERQCSLAKHWMAHHNSAASAHGAAIEDWLRVAATREFLPGGVDQLLGGKMRQVNWPDDASDCSGSALRKARSMDASCLDLRALQSSDPQINGNGLTRAKSELQLSTAGDDDSATPSRRPRSVAVPSTAVPSQPPPTAPWDPAPVLCRALYAYLSSGDSQLSFLEGDMIAPLGERQKGWQYGENLRTQCSGWFPLAYTEVLDDSGSPCRGMSSPGGRSSGNSRESPPISEAPTPVPQSAAQQILSHQDRSPQRMFGDTLLMHRNSKMFRRVTGTAATNQHPGPPPAAPAPVPTPVVPPLTGRPLPSSHSANFTLPSTGHANKMKTSKSHYGFGLGLSHQTSIGQPVSSRPSTVIENSSAVRNKIGAVRGAAPAGNISLHSSNDSGFSNEPPPQPEVDYSDDEHGTRMPARTRKLSKSPLDSPEAHENRIRQSSSYGNLFDQRATSTMPSGHRSLDQVNNGTIGRRSSVKRTRSFWRFGRSDTGILEGMALWKHRDLVDITSNTNANKDTMPNGALDGDAENNNPAPKRDVNSNEMDNQKLNGEHMIQNGTKHNFQNNYGGNTKHYSGSNGPFLKSDIDNRISKHEQEVMECRISSKRSQQMDDDEETITATLMMNDSKDNEISNSSNALNNLDNHFYDDDSDGLLLKTVKRKEILKQYNHSTESDTDSTTSDPYDCIVVDDHLAASPRDIKKMQQAQQLAKYREHKDENIGLQEKNRNHHNEVKRQFKTFHAENDQRNDQKPSYQQQQQQQQISKKEAPEALARTSLLPRTKLSKSSSVGPTMQTIMKFEQEIGLLTYGSTLRDRMRVAGVNPNTGNTYGPWGMQFANVKLRKTQTNDRSAPVID
ncbi:uncharacterized protein LOC113373210 isoform X2 [Ctenocephalides felis]|uniref:uncharacterized protein LOC113373210 isoform X2 n=1 Tax=Ctenocephalides felis TaxID=7515 RepID=UPI000E6E4FDA|nr:uncharacterized protein LOC113373210 isoform X2 [Ctenocephalides felis]